MTERSPIRTMSPDLALKIAAGEVVERPASAVKELLDNAIDAGATRIAIEIREAGLKLIRISDNGMGIPREEVPLAFTSHATSKIGTLDDLEHLTTLGFRGEALPSIAAVGRVEVQTRTDEEPVGTRYAVEFGEPNEVEPCSTPCGMRISIADLFGNVPARRKFVRSLRAEGGQIASVVSQYSMAQPAVQFSLSVDGRSTFESPGTGKLADALAAVYGAGVLADMHAAELDEAGVHVSGLISAPGTTRSNRVALHIFVNGRPVANRSLLFALEEAYSGFLMVGRHPIAALHLTLSPADVDPNIHPSKSEVRFARNREVHGVLHRAVANALLEIRLGQRAVDISIETPSEETEHAIALPLTFPEAANDDSENSAPSIPDIPALRVFGQTNATFIIAEGPQGLYMIDQHAAHERILFDQFDEQLDGGRVASQPLLEPASLDLEPGQMLALDTNADLLAQAGFMLEPFGTDACLIRAVPALAGRGTPGELVAEVLRELENLTEPGSARERALAAMACKAAVKAGQVLEVREMRELVTQLERTLRPATCPHGRPTMIHLSHSQLEKEFGRR